VNIWFSADWHLGHANIIKYCNRPFKSIQEHDNALIANINAVVDQEDTLYFLGDFCMSRDYKIVAEYRRRINCAVIVMLLGNHDRMYAPEYRSVGFLSEGSPYCERTINNQRITMCHYAMRVWNHLHHGSWHLYGHSHGGLPEDPVAKSMDVGIDCHPEYRPFSYSEIKMKLDKKPGYLVGSR